MSLIALVSAKGSPGVTTTALALAHTWPGRVLLAECDPAGGDIAAGYQAGNVDSDVGLLELTVTARRTDLATALAGQLVALDEAGTRLWLPGIHDASQAAAVGPWWDRLGEVFVDLAYREPPSDVLADCGRLDTAHPPAGLLRRASTVAVVARPTLRSVVHVQAALERLRALAPRPDRVAVVLVGEGRPYTRREVARALQVEVRVLMVADDARSAAVFSGGAAPDRRLATSPLLRTARALATQLADPAEAEAASAARPAGGLNGRTRSAAGAGGEGLHD